MADFTINKLSEDDIKQAYRFIYVFEKEVHPRYGSFDFNSQDVNKFCQEHKINKKSKANNAQKMYGKISADLFWKYLNMVLPTSHLISKNITFK